MILTPSQRDADVRFWLGQDAEHCLFFALGFEDPALKAEAQRLYELYQPIRARDDLAAGLQLLRQSQDFKRRAHAAALQRWVGWIFPLFIEHTALELDTMLLRIQPSGISSRHEICFANRIGQEHCQFGAQLLDPTETATQNALEGLAHQAGDARNRCLTETYATLLALSKNAAGAIDQAFSGVDLAKTKSVIHPALAAHVVREGKYMVASLARLSPTENA